MHSQVREISLFSANEIPPVMAPVFPAKPTADKRDARRMEASLLVMKLAVMDIPLYAELIVRVPRFLKIPESAACPARALPQSPLLALPPSEEQPPKLLHPCARPRATIRPRSADQIK